MNRYQSFLFCLLRKYKHHKIKKFSNNNIINTINTPAVLKYSISNRLKSKYMKIFVSKI